MARKSRVFYRNHIAAHKMRRLMAYFCEDLSASQTARLTGLSLVTVNRHYRMFRERMAAECEAGARLEGVLEADESYFGAKRVGGKRGRRAGRTFAEICRSKIWRLSESVKCRLYNRRNPISRGETE